MKTLLKFVAYAAGALVLTVALAAAFIYVRSNAKLKKTYAVTVAAPKIPTDAESLARGKYLARTRGCADCHGENLAGKTVFANAPMGQVDAPNLTRGAGGLTADYRDEDFVRAIRHGVARDGRGLFLMPSTDYATFSENDMGALIAYLKSLPPVDKPRGPVALGPIARALTAAGKIKLAAEEIDHANVKPAVVTIGATTEYGRYVAAACTGCHGPNFSGGKIAVGPPEWPPAANLTPHADGRVAKWTEADFMQAIRTGKRPDGTELNPAMPRAFGNMDDTELRAMWLYFKTLPAVATGVR
ncbi:MAG: cytochrome c [Verrucomicrobiota bacterium]